jgi:hypothetical protein
MIFPPTCQVATREQRENYKDMVDVHLLQQTKNLDDISSRYTEKGCTKAQDQRQGQQGRKVTWMASVASRIHSLSSTPPLIVPCLRSDARMHPAAG